MECDNKERKNFLPIDVMYDPVKHQKIKINYYFSTHKYLAYRSTFSEGDNLRHGSA